MADPIRAEFEVLDERFRFFGGDHVLERLHTGCRWTEGPAYFPAGRYLVFSDIPNDRLLRWDETTGVVGEFLRPAGYANGHSVDRRGRLLSCEHGNRRVTRTEADGSVTVLADAYDGKRLNSPNDVVERADGSVWFTDPAYGIDSDYEGHRAESEIGGCHVYRIDPVTGRVAIVADDFDRPNGLAFSADERQLYITDSERDHIRLFSVTEDSVTEDSVTEDSVTAGARLDGGAVFATCDAGHVRRDPARLRRPDLGLRRRRAALLRPGRHADRQAPGARDRGQPGVRRPAAQPAVYLRDHLAVLDPGQRDGRGLPGRAGHAASGVTSSGRAPGPGRTRPGAGGWPAPTSHRRTPGTGRAR